MQNAVTERACRICEYCCCPMDYSSQPFVFEHIIPISREGETTLENLALACGGCNGHKYNKINSLDPIDQKAYPLFHPRQQPWIEHFTWNEDFTEMLGVSPIGRATVNALRLNRTGVVNIRQVLVLAGKHPPKF